jgi:hypothetical protein
LNRLAFYVLLFLFSFASPNSLKGKASIPTVGFKRIANVASPGKDFQHAKK